MRSAIDVTCPNCGLMNCVLFDWLSTASSYSEWHSCWYRVYSSLHNKYEYVVGLGVDGQTTFFLWQAFTTLGDAGELISILKLPKCDDLINIFPEKVLICKDIINIIFETSRPWQGTTAIRN